MGLCRDPLVGHHAGSEGMQLAGSNLESCWLEQVTLGVWGVLRQVVQGVFGGQAVGMRAMQCNAAGLPQVATAPLLLQDERQGEAWSVPLHPPAIVPVPWSWPM